MEWVLGLIGLLVVLGISMPLISTRVREIQLSKAGFGDISRWTQLDMLNHLTHLFGSLGYRVSKPSAVEEEFDLVLTDGLAQKRAVLARHWRSLVDENLVLGFAQAVRAHNKGDGIIITLERYTYKARETAKAQGITLWSLPDLAKSMQQVKQTAIAYPELPVRLGPPANRPNVETKQRTLPTEEELAAAVASENPAYVRLAKGKTGPAPRCPRCGRKMVIRTTEEANQFWSCPTFPRCLGSKSL